ncbi:phage shock protein C, PspC [Petrotoga mobilis SJ95]|uniref:Phage shock protein C, PspC n=1 Tax=Petrotoga mobilis (strain DSM 10674 / SJ95) TaxID=403833 RepID=A9BHG4_PETMO|nr:PspC domain-containing protein [Petrotoga mobilis]ABX31573.1 phage shock protein C, PspC [Petrotoga mobilis SJ95]
MRKLYRSRENKILAGVCGGIGEYFEIDPVIIRLLWIVLSLVWGFGVILYIIAIFIIPPQPQGNRYSDEHLEETPENERHNVSHNLEDEDRKVVIGLFALLFIVIGLIILVSIITPSTFFFRNFIKIVISILLIGIGAYLISTSRTKK